MESNQTALRVLMIMSWLIERPHSMDELNQRCRQDMADGETLSDDSVGLYIKTLRYLGCHIQRPTRSNGYRYSMVSHPFQWRLSSSQLNIFSSAKMAVADHLGYEDLLGFDHAVCSLLQATEPVEAADLICRSYFKKNRSINYAPFEPVITHIEMAIQKKYDLQLQYSGSRYGRIPFRFMPVSLIYEGGVLYLRGYRFRDSFSWEGSAVGEKPQPEFLRLRVDRIEGCDRSTECGHPVPKVGDELQASRRASTDSKDRVELYLLTDLPFSQPPLNLGETWQYVEGVQGIEKQAEWYGLLGYTQVVVHNSDWFIFKTAIIAARHFIYGGFTDGVCPRNKSDLTSNAVGLC